MKRNILALRLLSVAGLGTLLAASSFAQEGGYFYGGLSVGQSRAKIDEDRITDRLSSAGLSTTDMRRDERDTAYKLFGGYQFNRHFALEAGYFKLGTFGFRSTTMPDGTLEGEIKLQGVNLDLVGTLPLTERWSALARVGVQHAKASDRFSGSGAVSVSDASPSKRDTNYKIGAGLQYAFSPSFLMRAEVERYRINDAVGNDGDINLVSLSVVFPFGRAPAPGPRLATAPAYVPPAPAAVPTPAAVAPAAPAPAVIAAAPVPRRVSFSADSLFAFDQSGVRAEGRTELDRFLRDMRGSAFDVITVEGHTDRLGSPAYNEKLSFQRAEAVKAYLVAAGGLPAAKISAVGKSESAPLTKTGDCKGSRASPQLIACLQPDRRVEVEVSGTR